ncbi:MAG TPA: PAS domain S-box protein [Ramlibacter sp.]|nr:PAS domain S-box protein [Ramlibacter sp.]
MTSSSSFQLDGGSLSLHRAIVEQAQDAVIFADRGGIIQLWNRGAEIIFGYAAAEAIGQSLDIIVPERFRQAHNDGFMRALGTGRLRNDGRVLTTRAQNKFGSRLYVDLSFGLLKDEAGTVIGAFAIGRDATARHLEQVARRVGAEAQAA